AAFRLVAPGLQCALVLGAGPADRAALRQYLVAGADVAVCAGLQHRPVAVRRAGRIWRAVRCALRAVGLLLAIPDAGAERAFRYARGVVVMMLGWLVLCLSGLVTMLGFGAIANAAHVGGLVIGCLCGAIAGGVQRRVQ